MQYVCDWLDKQKTILLVKVLSEWTWDDAYSALTDHLNLLESVTHDVYSIYDMSAAPKHPTGLTIPHLKYAMSTQRPNQKLTFFVGLSFELQMLFRVTQQAFQLGAIFRTYRFANTLDEALRMIDAHKLAQHIP